jgi:hypothetical protein
VLGKSRSLTVIRKRRGWVRDDNKKNDEPKSILRNRELGTRLRCAYCARLGLRAFPIVEEPDNDKTQTDNGAQYENNVEGFWGRE